MVETRGVEGELEDEHDKLEDEQMELEQQEKIKMELE
jgi:hypothetical protein